MTGAGWITTFRDAWMTGGIWIWLLALMSAGIWALSLKTFRDLGLREGGPLGSDLIVHRIRAIRVLSATAPLLGLMGTVSAMITMFAGLHAEGFSGDRAMAGGIAQALVSTQAGLLAAIPGILMAHLLERRHRAGWKGRGL
ncbi:MotA/TolQ/ExbB proton channel family protein [Desulfobotulus alkaliphilus]|uniref:MotA/TolQ/ExbB proton channel family protein n=1 Tax=Desulfobotulus alkaliphilus TaxID=622671 RepID=A0A562RRL5_9BACT|nr:MotA/TolQ/ExbB proton channel family protein [Desulfobotulus alkaliphilus]TWI71688.1 MotA/TolQ/ExbB proton channel family protein [Desulfobotulus alkaliphilus]